MSGFVCAGLVLLLLLLTTWSSSWRRMLAWEEDFWKRRRVGGWLLTRLRRMETNKSWCWLLSPSWWFILVCWRCQWAHSCITVRG